MDDKPKRTKRVRVRVDDAADLRQPARVTIAPGGDQTRAIDRPPGFAYIGLRIPVALKAALETAARAAGRSLASEVHRRLDRSVSCHSLLAEIIATALDVAPNEPIPSEEVGRIIRAALVRRAPQ